MLAITGAFAAAGTDAAGAGSPAAMRSQLPTFGEPMRDVQRRLGRYANIPGKGSEVYRLRLNGADLQLGVRYSKDPRGESRVRNVSIGSQAMSPSDIATFERQYVDGRARQLSPREYSAMQRKDAETDPGETVRFYRSENVARQLGNGACAAARASDLEVLEERRSNGWITINIWSEFAYYCWST